MGVKGFKVLAENSLYVDKYCARSSYNHFKKIKIWREKLTHNPQKISMEFEKNILEPPGPSQCSRTP